MRPSSRSQRLGMAAMVAVLVLLSGSAIPLNTSAQTDPPAKPTGLSTLAGDTKVKLTWEPPGDGSPAITSYQLWQLAQNSKLTADITLGNQFGYSVAVDGDTAVIGVYGDGVPDSVGTLVANAGSAYVFTRNTGTGVWSKAAMLTASVPTENDHFGISVAIDGGTVVVGAHQLDYELNNIVASRSGAAYVFTRPDNGWADTSGITPEYNETAKLTPGTAGAAGDRFGVSVAVRGDTVVVGAHQHDGDAGAAYVFTKPSGSAWVSTSTAAKLTASDSAASDQFGSSVAVDGETDGDTVVVGASQGDSADAGGNSITDSGAAYVYTKPGTGWADSSAETAKLTASDGAASDEFGISVAVDDDTVVVGASGDDGKGSVYVYTKPSGSAWADSSAETAKLIASDGAASDEFGISVAVDGDTVVVGAHKHDVTPSRGGTAVANTGAAYVFTKPGSAWASTSTAAKVTASDRAANDKFGSSVAVDGDTVMVGAYSHDNGDSTTADSGAVYVFGSLDWNDIADSGADTTSHLVTGLTNSIRYTFRIRAVNAIGASDPSDHVAATPPVARPARPTNFSAVQTGVGQVSLEWDESLYPLSVASYQFTKDDGVSWTDIPGSDYDTDSYTVTTGLSVRATPYIFAVQAVNNAGATASDSQPVIIVDKPAAPDSFTAVAGDEQVWLGWRSPADFTISGYEYQQKTGGDFGNDWTSIPGSRSGTTFHIVTGLTNGTSYTFRVRAFNAAGGSDSSGEQSATPATASSAPVEPEGFSASQTGVGQVELTWDPSSNPLTVTGYEFTQNNGSTWTTISGSDSGTVSHTLNNLNTGNYTFAIRAVNGPYVGDSSGAQSLTVVAKLVALTGLTINDPEPGSGIESDIGDTQVRLKWNDPGNTSITKYQVLQFPESIKLIFSDRDDEDELGWSVAVDDDTLVIGALGDDDTIKLSGSAYVFTRVAGGWIQAGKLTASDPKEDAGFGHAVAVHGDTIVVGAYEEDHTDNNNNPIDDVGAAYVFTKPANGWADMTQTARLTASDAAAEDEFGTSVAVHGDTIVVGAPEEDTGARGSAYIFTKPANDWADMTETAALRGESGGDRFGRSVAVYGDTVVVGAFEVTGTRGAAYLFTKRAATGVWDDWDDTSASNATPKLTASDRASGDRFGRAVAMDGDTIVIGAPYHDYDDPDNNTNDVSNSGAAYVFIKPATGGWATDTETAKLTASERAENDQFGYSVAVDGNTVVVGADQDDSNRGSAYVFAEPQGGWTDTEGTDPLTAYDRSGNDRFGNFVAVDGDTVLVGAVGDDSDKGSAYVFGTGEWADIPGSGAGTISHIARALRNNVKHTFRVRAVNAAGESGASEVAATPVAATFGPSQPADLTATQTGVGQVLLAWTASTEPLTVRRYQYKQNDGSGFGNWINIEGSDSSTASHTITSLGGPPPDVYTFTVGAVNGGGQNASEVESVTLEAQAAAPSNLDADAGDEQVKLSWDDPGDSTIDKYQHFQIDPSKLTAADGLRGDEFGYSVAVDGNTAVIGAYQDDHTDDDSNTIDNAGSAYVFTKVSGVWRQLAKLTASDGDTSDEFGYSVAVDGDTIVVGAHLDDHTDGDGDTDDDEGAAYVFTKPANGWADMTQTAKLTAFGAAASDEFGISVAVDGDTILVGAHQNDSNKGAAYIFTEPFTGWANSSETAKLIASDGAANDEFGISVAVHGDIAVIGARQDDTRNGSAYVFTRVSGVWSQEAKLIASDGAANDEFGISVAVDGDTILVGAHQNDSNKGAAYIFTEVSGVWKHVAKLTADDGAANDEFGISVAVDGDTIVVGAHQDDDKDDLSGSAYVFTRDSAGGWRQRGKLTASDGEAGDRYGYSVGVSGDTVVVGAYSDDSNEANTGAAYFLRIPGWTDIPDSAATTTSHIVTGLTNDEEHTFQVRGVNAAGEGLASARAVGTPTFAIPNRPTGFTADAGDAVVELSWDDPEDSTIDKYQLLQITQGGKLTAASTDDPVVRGDGFGISVAVDGNTAVVGAYRDDDDGANSGSAHVFTRSSSTAPWSWSAKLTASDAAANDEFGISVAADGDTIVVGAYQNDSNKGAAYVFTWNSSNSKWEQKAKLTASDAAANDEFGISVAVDGDTIVVGAHQNDSNKGAAYVFTKPESGGWADATETAKLTASDAAANDEFGISVAVHGETVVVGAHQNDSNKGAAYVFTKPGLGGWADATETAKLTASDGAASDEFGISVAVHGDTVVLGAHKYDVGGGTEKASAGAAYVFTKPETDANVDESKDWKDWASLDDEGKAGLTAKLIAFDAARGDEFGISVAVDDDEDTIVVGAYLDDDNGDNSGSAYVFTRDSNGWSQKTKLTGPSRGKGDWLGYSVAVAGDTVLAGAYESNISGPDSGAVYLWVVAQWADINGSGPTTTSQTVTGLTNRLEYSFQVRAVDKVEGADAGPPTDPLRATPLKPRPAKPTGLSAAHGDTQVRLSWNLPGESSPPINSYQLWQHAENAILTAPGPTTDDEFGYAVAIDGDTAVVGMPGDDDGTSLNVGAAFVFTSDSSGTWTQVAKLRASDPNAQDRFGLSVAVHEDTSNGDTIVVGAPHHSSSRGAVYVFTEPSGGWASTSTAAKLTASDRADDDEFGDSVAVDGDTVVVGAHNNNAAYVFTRPAAGWANTTETLKLSGSGDFGRSVAIDGDTIVVGASGDDSGTGSAFVFIKPATGWANSSGTEVAKLTAYDGENNDRFGRSVAIDGYTIVVGAYEDDGDRGSAYVFTKPDTGWANSPGTEMAQLTASDRAANDEFGRSVSVDGDAVAVGAYGDDGDRGSAYVFTKPNAEWVDSSEAAKLPGPGDSDDDQFGWSVAVDRGTILVGAGWHGSNDAGAAYLYDIQEWAPITGSTGETRSHFATGLTNGLEHTFAVRAVNEGGASGPSNQASGEPGAAASAPAKPTNFSAVQVGAGEVRLAWEPGADPLTIVRFEYTDNAGENENWKEAVGSHSTTVSDLMVGTTYTFAIRAVNSAVENDGRSAPSDPWSVTIAVAPADGPTGLTALAGDEQVQLSWHYSGSQTSITGFQYQQKTGGDFGDDWTSIPGSRSGTTFHIVTGLTNGTSYTFRVRAFNAAGGSDSSGEQSATPATASSAPVEPEGFSASQTGVGQVELTWDPSSNPLTVTGYEFTQNNGSTWTTISGSDSGTVSHIVSGLMVDTMYAFAVRAVNSGMLSGFSSSFRDVTIIDVPNMPTGLGTTGGDTQATFHWNVTVETTDRPIDKHQLLHLPQSKLTADDGADDDEFGYSVAIDGNTAVVGAHQPEYQDENDMTVEVGPGAAYVFVKADGAWSQAAKLTARSPVTNDEFGYSVAVDGGTVVVGAPGSNSNTGAVYVFTKPDAEEGWASTSTAATLTAFGAEGGDEFGISVAVEGTTVVVGGDQNGNGATYVFTKPGSGGWADATETAKLTASDGAAADEFGISVSLNDDTVVVGAHQPQYEANGANVEVGPGAAYVFTKPASGGWAGNTEGAKFTAPDGAANDEFGVSVAIDVDVVVVGAHLHDVGANANAGAAYVFTRDSNSGKWSQPLKLTASNGHADDGFGNSVEVDGNTAVVGAYLDDRDNAARDTGSTYVFARKLGVWSQTLNLAGPGPDQNDRLGYSVAVDDGTLLAGTPQDDNDPGFAYAMDISDAEWTDFVSTELTDNGEDYFYRVLNLTNDQEYAFRVRSVNAAANRPSNETVAATPKSAKPGKTDGLSAQPGDSQVTLSWDDPRDSSLTGYQVLRPPEQTKFTAGSDGERNGAFGASVAVDDAAVVVGAPKHNVGSKSNAGAAYVFTEVDGVWSGPIELTAGSDGAENDWFGYSVAVEGNVAVIGAYQHDTNDNADAGAAYVFIRNPLTGVWSEPVKLIADDGAENDWFGYSVAVDGETIVVGARWHNGKAGAAYVFTRNSMTRVWGNDPEPGGIHRVETAKLTASDGGAFNYFGHSVAVDGETIVIGAPGYNTNMGVAYVFTRNSMTRVWGNDPEPGETHRVETAKLTAFNGHAGDGFGNSVAVDGENIVVGAQQGDGERGSAYVFTEPTGDGGWADNTETAKLAASDREGGDHFGNSVAVRGGSIVVGAYTANINECDECDEDLRSGAAYVFTKSAGAVWANDPNKDHRTESDRLTLPIEEGVVEKSDEFGNSVAMDGRSILVGAPEGNDGFGSVYVSDIPQWALLARGAETTSATVEGLTNGVEYAFQVRAVDFYGEGLPSDIARAKPKPAPAAPNGAPYFIIDSDSVTFTVDENTPLGSLVGDAVTAEDPDGDVLTYSLSGIDASSFVLDGSTGQITVGSGTLLDYESGYTRYTVIVSVHDGRGAYGDDDSTIDDLIEVSIDVSNVDEAGTVSVSLEQPEVGTAVAASLSDPDGLVSNISWQWARSSDGSDWSDISGANSDSYTPVADDVGIYLQATASYTDGHGPGKSAHAVMEQSGPGTPRTGGDTDDHGDGHGPGQTAQRGPSFEGDVTFTVDENTPLGSLVGDAVTAEDPDGDVLTYSLSGIDASSFVLDGSTGQITVGSGTLLDYESGYTRYTVIVSVHDGRGAYGDDDSTIDDLIGVSIDVSNVDEAGTVSVSLEQPEVGTAVAASLSDPDGLVSNISWQWARSSDGSDWSDISGANSDSYTPVADDVGIYLQATASYTDGHGPGKSAHAVMERQTAQRGPSFEGDVTFTVDENTPLGSLVGDAVTAEDPDGDVLTYSLSGIDASSFVLDGSTGQITVGSGTLLDYESGYTRYTVIVSVHDGRGAYGDDDSTIDDLIEVSIDVSNVDEAGTVSVSLEQPEVGTAVAASLSDPDGLVSNISWQWARSSDGSDWSDISGANSDSYTPVADDVGIYLQATASYTDGHGPGKSAHAVMERQTAQRGPSFEGDVTFTVDENTPLGSLVGDAVTAEDPDGDVLTYSLSGIDASSFVLDGSTGQITVGSGTLLDYESGYTRYTVIVSVHDGRGAYGDDDSTIDDLIEVSIDVSNVDEAGTVSVSLEQPEVGTAVAASLSDPDGLVSNISWQWARSSDGSDWSDISGANSDSYTPVADDVGIYLQATASYTDGHGPGKSAHAVMERQTAQRGPSFEGDVTFTVDENTPLGSLVGDAVTAEDPDGDVLTYSLSGIDASSFVLDGSTGQITVGSGTLLDYESGYTRYTVIVSVHDGRGAYGDDDSTIDDLIGVSIDVSNVDEAGTVSVSLEQPEVGTAVAASLSDPDGLVSNISWQWARSSDRTDWQDMAGASSFTYTPVDLDADKYLRVTASYADGEGSGKQAQAVLNNPVQGLPEPVATPTTTATDGGDEGFPWWVIVAVVIGVVAGVVLIIVVLRSRR